MEALSLSLQVLTEPGDWVVVETPTFYGALQAIERLKLKAVEIPVIPGVGIDLAQLSEALAQRPIKACWLMGNVQHPLGHTMPDDHKRELMLLLNTHDVALVEDDVYAEVYFGRERPRPIKYWDTRGQSLLCSSFSKCLAPGFRVGWVVAGPHAERIQRLQLMSTLSTNVPSQLALAEMLRQGGVDAHFRRLRHTLAQRQQQMRAALLRLFPDEVRISAPDGGYFLWLEFAPVSTAEHCTPGRSPAASRWRPVRSSPVRGSTTTACASTAPIPGALSWKPPSPSWLNLFTSSSLPIWMPETTRPRDRGVIDNPVTQRYLTHCLPDDTIWHKFQTVV